MDQTFILEKKHFGLINLGGTCFFNSAVQALLSTPAFFNYIMDDDKWKYFYDKNIELEEKDIMTTFIFNLKQLLYFVNTLNKIIINPKDLFNSIKYFTKTYKVKKYQPYIDFSIGIQNDSFDMLNAILDIVHEETKNTKAEIIIGHPLYEQLIQKYHNFDINEDDVPYNYEAMLFFNYQLHKKILTNNYSELKMLFEGSIINITECRIDGCGHKSFGFMYTNIYELNIYSIVDNPEKKHMLTDYIDNQFEESTYSDNHIHKIKTGHPLCYSYHKFWALPTVLIIRLKRFAIINGIETKLNYPIEIPKNLDMKKYVHMYAKNEKANINSKYKLVSVINHVGECNGGHYYSCGIGSDNYWYEYNDSIVSRFITAPEFINSNIVIYQKI